MVQYVLPAEIMIKSFCWFVLCNYITMHGAKNNVNEVFCDTFDMYLSAILNHKVWGWKESFNEV
jgi:hypothetical protein